MATGSVPEPTQTKGPETTTFTSTKMEHIKQEDLPEAHPGMTTFGAVVTEAAGIYPTPQTAFTTHPFTTDEDQKLADIENKFPTVVVEDDGTKKSQRHSHSGSSTANEEALATKEDHIAAAASDLEGGPNPPTVESIPYSSYTKRQKQFIVLAAATASVFSPLSMQIYLPSLNTLADEFDVSHTQINLTVTVFLIFMALSPMVVGGIADLTGRRPAILFSFAIYIVACVILAMAKNYLSLLVFRMIQSIGASPTVAIASAVVADTVTSSERGAYVALVAVPVIFAPTLGPVFGGLLDQYLGWRSIFWFLCIGGVLAFVLILLFFPETCRYIVGDASGVPPKTHQTVVQMIKYRGLKTGVQIATISTNREPQPVRGVTGRKRTTKTQMASSAFLGSVKTLFTQERFYLLIYVGIIFGGFSTIATALPAQLKSIYGFNSLTVGLMYLPMAGGSMISTLIVGRQMNKQFKIHAAAAGIHVEAGQQIDMINFPVEKARLKVTLPSLVLTIVGMYCWGWVLEARTNVAAPCVILFVLGCGLNGVMATTNALLMDITSTQAGAAMAASNMTRCLLGAAAAALIQPLINVVGVGWAYVVIGSIYTIFSPMLLVTYLKGHQFRRNAAAREEKRKEKKRAAGEDVDGDDGFADEPVEGLTSLRFSTLQMTPSRPDARKMHVSERPPSIPPLPSLRSLPSMVSLETIGIDEIRPFSEKR